MASCTVLLELPEELTDVLGSPEAAATMAREALVIELLREARIGQSFAAEVLGVTRWDVIDLMAEHQITSGPETLEELRQELDGLRHYSEAKAQRDGDQ